MENFKLIPPSTIYKLKIRRLRCEDVHGMVESLANLCDQYWNNYCKAMMLPALTKRRLQAWYCLLAYRKVLEDYGWWDENHRIPLNFTQESVNDDSS